jgi:hypothetical protein
MNSTDYMPTTEVKILSMTKNLAAYATINAARWKVPEPEDLPALIEKFEYCMIKMENPNHGKLDVREKNEAKALLVKACRIYVQGFIAKNPFVTNSDKDAMGLPVYDTKSTPIADPTGQAEADIMYVGKAMLEAHFKHISSTPANDPANYGRRVYYGLFAPGETPPASGKDMHESRFTRRKKLLFTFEPEDSGKTAYFAIRYENSKGKMGPWGPMFSAIIP